MADEFMTGEQLQGLISGAVAPVAQQVRELQEYVSTERGKALKPEVIKAGEMGSEVATMERGLAVPKQVRNIPWMGILGGVGGLVLSEAIDLKWSRRVLVDPAKPEGPTKVNMTNILVKGGGAIGSMTLGRKYLGKDVGTGLAIVLGVSAISVLAEESLQKFIDTVAGWFGYEAPVPVGMGQGHIQNVQHRQALEQGQQGQGQEFSLFSTGLIGGA